MQENMSWYESANDIINNSQEKEENKERTSSDKFKRQIHSLLVKNLSATYLGYEDCGIMLHLLYKLSKWGNTQTMVSKMSKEENEWLQLDIHHFISREFSIDQLLAQLRRMENYYLRL